MQPKVEDTVSWYKQFWPWVLIALPASAVVAGIYTYTLAASGSSGLVVDDYYKAGKAINRSLERGQQAAQMGLQADMALSDGAVRLLLDDTQVAANANLVLQLSHATLPGRDQAINLQYQGGGSWQGGMQPLSAGKWYVHLSPEDKQWRLSGTLPNAETLSLQLLPAL